MNIESFKVSNDRTKLQLVLTNAAGANVLHLWDNTTYRYTNLVVDISNLLVGGSTQNIEISLEELELPYFDGVYFIEVSDGTNVISAMTADLTKYKECIMNKVLSSTGCDSCLKQDNPEVTNAQTLLRTLEDAIEAGFIQEILNIIKVLEKFCGGGCNNCGKYRNQINNHYFTFNITSTEA